MRIKKIRPRSRFKNVCEKEFERIILLEEMFLSKSDKIFFGREVESFTGHASPGSVLPERLTPLMFSRPHVCARMSASGLLVKVEPNNPRVNIFSVPSNILRAAGGFALP